MTAELIKTLAVFALCVVAIAIWFASEDSERRVRKREAKITSKRSNIPERALSEPLRELIRLKSKY